MQQHGFVEFGLRAASAIGNLSAGQCSIPATVTERSWIIAKRVDLDLAPSSPTWHTVLDIVGDLLTNRCQLKKLLFYRRLFGRFGKLPKLCRFVPKIISPIHATRTMFEGSDDRPRPAALDAHSAPATLTHVRRILIAAKYTAGLFRDG
jgi:hypothetical protein